MFLLLTLILNGVGVLARVPALRIVGGRPVPITERPFQVLIYHTIPSLRPHCGGSIINHRWILTAAHCVQEIRAKHMVIRAGSDTIDDDTEAQWYKVAKSIAHERFDDVARAMTHDIALLKTDRSMKFGPTVQPIRLRRKSPRISMKAIISGFGKTSENGRLMSNILKEVSVAVLDRRYCIRLLSRVTNTLGVSNTHFCAAYLEGGRDACQGDSGGPITIGNSLAGVVSWGIGCANKYMPAFYTDVSKFRPWITKTIRKNSKRSRTCKTRRSNRG